MANECGNVEPLPEMKEMGLKINFTKVPAGKNYAQPTNLTFEFNAYSRCIDRVTLAGPRKLKWERRSDDNMT